MIDQSIKDVLVFRNIKDKWTPHYKKVKVYIEKYHKSPSVTDKNPEIKKLASWYNNQHHLQKDLISEKADLLEELPGWSWEPRRKNAWNIQYQNLKIYVEKYNEIPYLSNKNKEIAKLARWCSSQCQFKRDNRKLTPERINLLESLPKWNWGAKQKDAWMSKYQKLKEYLKKYRTVPTRTNKNKEIRQIGSWCERQREINKGGRTYDLSPKRIVLLNAIPEWYWERKDDWISKYQELKNYVKKYNKMPPLKNKDKKIKNLMNWCHMQRRALKGKYRCTNKHKPAPKLTPERIAMLNNIPYWRWEKKDVWTPKYQELKKYIKKYGKIPSVANKNREIKKLGSWCACQREAQQGSRHNEHKMTPKQIELLSALPGWFWNNEERILLEKYKTLSYNEL